MRKIKFRISFKIDKNSYKNFYLLHWVCDDQRLETCRINSVNPLYLIFRKGNEYFGETNAKKYLTLIPTNESKENILKNQELWSEIRDLIRLIRLITKNPDDYDEKYIKIKLNLDVE